jgi:hypothetical protein
MRLPTAIQRVSPPAHWKLEGERPSPVTAVGHAHRPVVRGNDIVRDAPAQRLRDLRSPVEQRGVGVRTDRVERNLQAPEQCGGRDLDRYGQRGIFRCPVECCDQDRRQCQLQIVRHRTQLGAAGPIDLEHEGDALERREIAQQPDHAFREGRQLAALGFAARAAVAWQQRLANRDELLHGAAYHVGIVITAAGLCRRRPSFLGLPEHVRRREDGLHWTLELVQQRGSQPLQHLHRHRLPSQAPGVELRAPATHGLSLGSTAIAVSALASWPVSYGLVRNLKYGSCLKRSWSGVST